MVKISSSSGGLVSVQFTGLIETINRLRAFHNLLPTAKNIAIIKAADMVKEEVKESIVGNRGEPKSVDTGNFANSIDIKPIGENEYVIFTDIEYAGFLEYGTSKLEPRKHFTNTTFRVAPKVKEIFSLEVKNVKKETLN